MIPTGANVIPHQKHHIIITDTFSWTKFCMDIIIIHTRDWLKIFQKNVRYSRDFLMHSLFRRSTHNFH